MPSGRFGSPAVDALASPFERLRREDGPIKQDLDALRIDRTAEQPNRFGWGWLVVALVLLGGIAAAMWWWMPARAAPVRTATAQQAPSGGQATVLNASGYVTARRRATVASKITGKVTDVLVEEGVAVTRGDVLARLDDSQYRAAADLAQSKLIASRRAVEETLARLELAELTVKRRQRLVRERVMGQADLDEAETEVETLRARAALEEQQVAVAEREVDLRKTELADTVIRAPFDGVVISKDAQPGETVSPMSAGGGFTRTGICTIVDMSSLEIEVDVNESYISRVRDDQPIEAVLDAYPDWRITGRVITTIPSADRQKATVLVRIAFDALDPRILPDMGIKVAFRNERSDTDAPPSRQVLVPSSAVRQDGGRDVVFVVNDGRVERRAVTVGGTVDERVAVTAGLSAGQQVVVEGPEQLKDGDPVKVR